MALEPLATVDDLEARGLTVDPGETSIVNVYLGVASTAVREAAGTAITRTTSTITLEGVPGQRLTLPGAPIVSVDSVKVDGRTVTDWRLRSERLWRAAGWCGWEPSEVEVTSERLGDWSVTYAADGRVTEMELTQFWRERLAARFGNSVTTLMSR